MKALLSAKIALIQDSSFSYFCRGEFTDDIPNSFKDIYSNKLQI